jgi:hypothetical protein
MTVYLIHLDQPMPRGVNRKGKTLQARHYMGWAADLAGRIREHQNTMWDPPEQEGMPGTKYGRGANFIGVANYKNIRWRIVRTWDGADRKFEARLKNCKMGPDLCPVCNPRAMNRFHLENDNDHTN